MRIVDNFLLNSKNPNRKCLMGSCLYNQAHFCRKIELEFDNDECLSCESACVTNADISLPIDELIKSIQATRNVRVELNIPEAPDVPFTRQ